MGIEQWVDKDPSYESTLNLKRMIGVKVISKRGIHIGRVKEVRTDPQNLACEGVFVKSGIFGRKMYFSTKYIEKFSLEGVVLSIEPSFLLFGRKIITPDGKVIGKVREIERLNNTNQIKLIRTKKLFHKERTITADMIKTFGVSIMLKEDIQPSKSGG